MNQSRTIPQSARTSRVKYRKYRKAWQRRSPRTPGSGGDPGGESGGRKRSKAAMNEVEAQMPLEGSKQ